MCPGGIIIGSNREQRVRIMCQIWPLFRRTQPTDRPGLTNQNLGWDTMDRREVSLQRVHSFLSPPDLLFVSYLPITGKLTFKCLEEICNQWKWLFGWAETTRDRGGKPTDSPPNSCQGVDIPDWYHRISHGRNGAWRMALCLKNATDGNEQSHNSVCAFRSSDKKNCSRGNSVKMWT